MEVLRPPAMDADRPFGQRLRPEIFQVIFVGPAADMVIPQGLDRVDARTRAVLHDLSQERQARRAGALQRAALAQPRRVGIAFGREHLAMPHIGAADQAPPEAFHHLFARQLAPAFGDVALVHDFVEDHRLQRQRAVQLGP